MTEWVRQLSTLQFIGFCLVVSIGYLYFVILVDGICKKFTKLDVLVVGCVFLFVLGFLLLCFG